MKELILKAFSALEVPLREQTADALVKYYEILIERNKVMNLTRITDAQEVAAKHFADSVTPIKTGLVRGKVIDIGTGAGFPGLVLKCVVPELELTLLDSLAKRIAFLKDAATVMGIDSGISFIHARAEDAAHNEVHREQYDTVVSRAVANMRTLSEWCLPFVKTGGHFLALKGPLAESELTDARGAIEALGGKTEAVAGISIPYTELDHKIVIIKKVRQTPPIFPRKGKASTLPPVEKVFKRK